MERNRIDEKKHIRSPSGAALLRPDLTEALFRALFEEWAEVGYRSIRMEKVAARARVGKGAIYRRWSSKTAFATEAISTVGFPLTDVSDQGSLQADLQAYLMMFRRGLRHPLIKKILPDLYAERARSQELTVLLDALASHRRNLANSILERAISRNEIPDSVERDLAMDIIPSGLYWRMVLLGKHVTRPQIAKMAAMIAFALRHQENQT